MSVRVVLYAEGTRELRASRAAHRLPPAPGQLLVEDFDELGAAHVLLRRAIELAGVPSNAIQFEQGFRTKDGRQPRGSDFVRRTTVVPLMTWIPNVGPRAPDLAVLFVDCDGDALRYTALVTALESLPHPPERVVGVPVQEFEAWLISDDDALQSMLGRRLEIVAPESLAPREAKEGLEGLLPEARLEAQTTIASVLDLQRLQDRCPSFLRFVQSLHAALS